MKDITRRDFLRRGVAGGLAVTLMPSVANGLVNAETKADEDERLDYVSDHWAWPEANTAYVGGWNNKGYWAGVCELNTGNVKYQWILDFSEVPLFVDDEKKRTLAQHRQEGMPWETINGLYGRRHDLFTRVEQKELDSSGREVHLV